MSEPLECVLCLRVAPDVRMALIRYTDVKEGKVSVYFGTDPRCQDRRACEERAKVMQR